MYDELTSACRLNVGQTARVHHELIRHSDGETFNTGEIRNIILVIFRRITHYTLPCTRYKNMSVLEKGRL